MLDGKNKFPHVLRGKKKECKFAQISNYFNINQDSRLDSCLRVPNKIAIFNNLIIDGET